MAKALNNLQLFAESLGSTAEMMLGEEVRIDKPTVQKGHKAFGDLSAVIGFGGDGVSGVLSLRFTQAAALGLYEAMMGESLERCGPEVHDCIGEIANIVLGNAKTLFAARDVHFLISIPTIIEGPNHSIRMRNRMAVVDIPFGFREHSCLMEIALELGERPAGD